MQITPCVGRKVTMLATVVVMPGGLVLLAAVLFAVLLMRSARGQRLLIPLKRRIPPRARAHIKRVLEILAGEKLFLRTPPTVHSA